MATILLLRRFGMGMALLLVLVTGCSSPGYPELSKVPCESFTFGLNEGSVPARLYEYSRATDKFPRYYYFFTEKPLFRDGEVVLPERSQVVAIQPDARNRQVFTLKLVRPPGGGCWTSAEGVAHVDQASGTNVVMAFSELSIPRGGR